MCVGMFLVLLDVTVVNVALPSIASGLGADPAATQWIVDAYAVAIAGLLLAGGTVGDRIGHRRVVLTGLGVFGVASVACGLATGPGMLIAARAAQGAGAALLLPGSLAVITEAFPDRAARARALGIWAAVSSLALPAGPLLGGFLVSSGDWRLIFLVNVPVVLAALVAVPRLVPAGTARPERRGDAPGAVLAAVGLVAAVFTVIDAGEHGFRPLTVAGLAVALVCVAGFVARERHANAPMLPLDLLRLPAFVGPNLAAGAMNLVVNGLLFVTTLFLQGVQHRGPVAAGVALLPMFVPLAFLAPPAGRLVARFGPRPLLVGGALVAALGAAGYALLEPASGYLTLLPALVGLGVGAGLFTAPVVAAAMSAVPAERSGLASGINNTARQTGTALGVAVFGAVAGGTAVPGAFVHGVHVLAGLGAAVWIAVVPLVAWSVRRSSPTSTRSG
ncbi:DHA2 family methylenomycin A resistance protein-like MFS transporter [Pseudonocardia hierapolitana]|uniref:DHA2 family methylenomycin A resistance protein-like MFS transporter n=2 Tax=Pseudonocardia hierapolitana TaxID=1128676 RepID=A0A561SX54_9PSEU|nr:DHA2 family methylenomycin A resistance protein-like MFS transporter [Pseudonocardia hierapolitana]